MGMNTVMDGWLGGYLGRWMLCDGLRAGVWWGDIMMEEGVYLICS